MSSISERSTSIEFVVMCYSFAVKNIKKKSRLVDGKKFFVTSLFEQIGKFANGFIFVCQHFGIIYFDSVGERVFGFGQIIFFG